MSTMLGGLSEEQAGTAPTPQHQQKAPPRRARPAPSPTSMQAQQQAQHHALISLVLGKTLALQKSVRSRKHRDLHGKMDDAVAMLTEFKDVEWPPRREEIPLPDWMDVPPGENRKGGGAVGGDVNAILDGLIQSPSATLLGKEAGGGGGDGKSEEKVATQGDELSSKLSRSSIAETETMEEEEAAAVSKAEEESEETDDGPSEEPVLDVDASSGPTNDDDGKEQKGGEEPKPHPPAATENGVEAAAAAVSAAATTTTPLAKSASLDVVNGDVVMAPYDDDPEKNEPMHPAIVTSMLAFCTVMSSPTKTPKMAELALDCAALLITNRYVSGVAGGSASSSSVSQDSQHAQQQQRAGRRGDGGEGGRGEEPLEEEPTFLTYVTECVARCSTSTSEVVQGCMTKALLALMTSPKCGVHEASMLMAVRATFHVYLVSKSSAAREVSKATLVDMLKSVFNRMEAYDAMNRGEGGGAAKVERRSDAVQSAGAAESRVGGGEGSGAPQDGALPFSAFASQFHTDSYLLFRALCKLSAKTLPGDDGTPLPADAAGPKFLQTFTSASGVDPLALNSKLLSLELILAVFEHCGEAFRTGEKFIYAVQNYLCVSLLKNCMSNNTTVAHLSLKIFLLLVYKFKAHLKSEIEVFVANIFLRILESPNSSFEQKTLVLDALRALCSDPQMLTQIFLNYDCDFDAVNLYRNIVHNLTRLSGKARATTYSSNKKEVEQDQALSLAGLVVLVVILRAFLKALGLPGGDDDFDDDGSASSYRIRRGLNLDVGLAVQGEDATADTATATDSVTSGMETEELSVSAQDLKSLGTPREESADGDNRTSAADVAVKIVDVFDRKRTAQQNLETGCVKFTLSIKSGLLFFIENGFVHLDAKGVAHFFHEHKEKLDKTQIGEVLGKEPESCFVKDEGADPEHGGEGFYVRVLYHYVDAMDFTDMKFDEAIRLFLSGFRLPGEAQKIDRIMEKFAERYTRQNEEIFPSADTAFILAFSVIMLNTDLHNPSIKPEKRMTLESFIRNNRGISVDGGDLPEEFLAGIFNRIKAQPFTLKEDDDAREKANREATREMFDTSFLFDGPTFFGSSAEDRKREKFRKEREEMMAASEQLFRKRPGRSGAQKASLAASNQLTESVSPADVVKPMFDVTWGPLIGTLSQVLETANDDDSIAVCLNGFVYSVRLSSHSGMSLARDTFVNSLAKFTTLGSIKEMKRKNIESIRTLLSIAIIDGEFLGESWAPVLQCMSQLARLQLFASGLASDDKFLLKDKPPQEDVSIESGGFFRQPTAAAAARQTEEDNGRAVLAAVNEVLIDKVFSCSVKLSARSIVHFIEQLVLVSESEISGDSKKGISGVGSSTRSLGESPKGVQPSVVSSAHGDDGPRIFSLQRLVEVADYNMDVRPRISWAQMWEMMAAHFAKIGCHENAMVSMFAIDALRQLSFKFLEKPELSDFNFQRLFLRPFLLIMENPGSREDIRELILRCVDNMIRSMSQTLRSGWKIFFSILTLSASDSSEKISTLGLAILQRLLDEHLDELCRLTVFEDYSGEIGASDDVDDPKLMTAMQRRQRNANAEDFVSLCSASLAFVQNDETDNPLPIGLSMRALCHTACYADLIADKRVLPPVSGCQSDDPSAPGYTYAGLKDGEAEEMVIWRPLLDGLAAGLCSTAQSSSGDVGCVVQRGSLMTLRAILLRHGKMFSISQWSVILKQVILPAIQTAAEQDESPVTTIISESPSVSSLDFLSDALPLPPPPDDEGLMKFAQMAQNEESAPTRPLRQAELLVEASFADLRHGGDGNLSRAHGLAKKDVEGRNVHEQPFPDSWVATTAPIALGMLTDILGEIILELGKNGRQILWPVLLSQYQRWSIGTASSESPMEDNTNVRHNEAEPWTPCEALVRIGCKELNRVPHFLLGSLPGLTDEERLAWLKTLCANLAETLSMNVTIERTIHTELVESKLTALGIAPEKGGQAAKDGDSCTSREDKYAATRLSTPYGAGQLVRQRRDRYAGGDEFHESVEMDVIQLDFGATLYAPSRSFDKSAKQGNANGSKTTGKDNDLHMAPKKRVLFRETYLDRFIPALKIRCVAACCLQQHLPSVMDALANLTGKEDVSSLLGALEFSRRMSRKASLDEDLAHAFQEALFNEWGDGVEEVEAVMASVGKFAHRGGSEMFFLTQEAGANRAIVHLLSLLYCHQSDEVQEQEGGLREWDKESFAEPLLLERMMDVLENFLESEERDGALIDPNVWRMSSESGGKVALYCTSFASVVVSILNTILNFSAAQFDMHKIGLFPILCSLIRVQSDEIRLLVRDIFAKQVGLVVGVPCNDKK